MHQPLRSDRILFKAADCHDASYGDRVERMNGRSRRIVELAGRTETHSRRTAGLALFKNRDCLAKMFVEFLRGCS